MSSRLVGIFPGQLKQTLKRGLSMLIFGAREIHQEEPITPLAALDNGSSRICRG
jgi:hypothetical protein